MRLIAFLGVGMTHADSALCIDSRLFPCTHSVCLRFGYRCMSAFKVKRVKYDVLENEVVCTKVTLLDHSSVISAPV